MNAFDLTDPSDDSEDDDEPIEVSGPGNPRTGGKRKRAAASVEA
eukprot:COSAG02_NODE_11944_length_1626_cov_186.479371_1_plen_43_part_10